MEIRRATLRACLQKNLRPDRVDHIMHTLEPFFQMVHSEHLILSLRALEKLPDSLEAGATQQIREELCFALLHSFMKNLLLLTWFGTPTEPSDVEKRFFNLIFEWILCEYSSDNPTQQAHLHNLVIQTTTYSCSCT